MPDATAVLADHLRWVSDGGTALVRWTQHLRTHPPAVPGQAEACTGWVDVQLIDGGDCALGFNWTVTVAGQPADAHDALGPDDDLDTLAWFDLDDRTHMALRRHDPWTVWLTGDVDVHVLEVDQATLDALRDARIDHPAAPGFGTGRHELAWTVPVGRLPRPDQLAALTAAADVHQLRGGTAHLRVEPGWTTDHLSRTLAAWARAVTGVDVRFAYVDDPDDADPLLGTLAGRIADHDADRDAAARALTDLPAGPGGWPDGLAWVCLPACGWRWLPDGALHGERPSRCAWFADTVGIDDGAAVYAPVPPDHVDGGGVHPSGVPVCDDHAPKLAALGYRLVRNPR